MRKRAELPKNEDILRVFFAYLGNAKRAAEELGFGPNYVRKRFKELGLRATGSRLCAEHRESIFSKKYTTKELVKITGMTNSALRRHIRLNKIDMIHAGRKVSDEQLLEALKKNNWNQSRAARYLGLHRSSVSRMIKDRGLENKVKPYRGRTWRA